MGRKLFCEMSPLTYQISVRKERVLRRIKDIMKGNSYANTFNDEILPVVIYRHNSLIRRKLGNTDLHLQDNKAVNLSIAAPKVNQICIAPGEIFFFWKLVGNCSAKNGYMEGLTITNDRATEGIGGGLCQFTNLIHWLVLHTDLEIIEHHHHDGLDLFPDFGRQIPFGTGTSIVYDYLDYQFVNNTGRSYQLITYVDEEYLRGEIRSDKPQDIKYHIKAEHEHFTREEGIVYRNGTVKRHGIDKVTGKSIIEEIIKTNHARVVYDPSHLEIIDK